ncbi:MAG: glycosyl hydrolase family 18 protein [Bacteroides sp.]|nr:glycosyl hydrolase family 18 protein [Bacteroides sp.]
MIKILAAAFLLVHIMVQVNGQSIIAYAPYYRTFPAETDFSLNTHVHFFAVWPDSSGALLWPGQHDSISFYQKYKLIQNKLQDDQPILITFGGTSSAGSKHFSQMAGNSASLESFAQNAVSLCMEWGAQGIDIDWEWGQKLEAGEIEQSLAYEELMTRLRQLCDEKDLLLSTAVSASAWFGDNYTVNGVDQADYINVMSYTYNGAWSSTANHHAPLSKTESIGLSYWKNRGIAPAKLNPGVPFYGFKYEGANLPGQSYTSISTLTYTEVKNHIALGYQLHVDTLNGSYCSSASSIIFFDSQEDLSTKVEHVKDMGYHGIFIWERGQDDAEQTLSLSIYKSMENLAPVSAKPRSIDQNFRVFFSPNTGIELFSRSEDHFSAHLYSLDGKLLAASQHNHHRAVISTDGITSGIYIVIIRSREKIFSKKITL